MNIIVAGGRNFNNYQLLCERLDKYFKNIIPVIICGEAKGADSLGKKYALEKGFEVKSYPAQWQKYGPSAGYRRNDEMALVADALVAFWDGNSPGTKHMIEKMRKMNKPVRIVKY